MSDEKKQSGNVETYKYQPLRDGHQPTKGNLDSSNPPQGGSGMPSTPSSDSGEKAKK